MTENISDDLPVFGNIGPEQLEFGRRIAALRALKGMTQAQLSEMTGIPQSNISRIEHGTYNPTVKLLEKIASALGYRLDINFR